MRARPTRLGLVALAALAAAVLSGAPAASASDASPAPSPTPGMLAVGATAPAVNGASTFDGKIEQFDLSKALSNGAVVLYFFPKAFTEG